jgi:hypothetical protein
MRIPRGKTLVAGAVFELVGRGTAGQTSRKTHENPTGAAENPAGDQCESMLERPRLDEPSGISAAADAPRSAKSLFAPWPAEILFALTTSGC